jgi:hypothetical protein
MVMWPINASGGAVLEMTRLREIAMPNGMGGSVGVRRNWWETYVRGLSSKIAAKYNPEIAELLESKFQQALRDRKQDENHGPITTGFRAFGHSRGRRW